MNLFSRFKKQPPVNASPSIRNLEIHPIRLSLIRPKVQPPKPKPKPKYNLARLPQVKTKGRIYTQNNQLIKILVDTGLTTPCGIPVLQVVLYPQENEHED